MTKAEMISDLLHIVDYSFDELSEMSKEEVEALYSEHF
jgi:hypothetical protein